MPRHIKIGGWLALAGIAALAVGAGAHRYALRGSEARRFGYGPINSLKSIGQEIWIVDAKPISVMGLTVPVRMTVIRLRDGTVLLHSPTPHESELARAIEELGPVRHLVAPTTAHWKFVSDWQRAFPRATTWAIPGLRDRLQLRMSGLRLDHDLGDTAPASWSPDVRQGLIRGFGLCEAYLFHERSRTLVLTDLIENLEPGRLPAVTAAAARLARANDGRPALHVRAALLLGRSQARLGVDEMIALEPAKVVFAHGKWFANDGAARLRRAFDWFEERTSRSAPPLPAR